MERTARTTDKDILERISRRTDKEIIDDTSEGSECSELTLADICDLLDRYIVSIVFLPQGTCEILVLHCLNGHIFNILKLSQMNYIIWIPNSVVIYAEFGMVMLIISSDSNISRAKNIQSYIFYQNNQGTCYNRFIDSFSMINKNH